MKMARVKSAGLNIHETPNGRILANETLTHGDMLETSEHRMTETTDWVRVRDPLSGARGWVASRFLEWPAPPPDVPTVIAPPSLEPTAGLKVGLFIGIAIIVTLALIALAYSGG